MKLNEYQELAMSTCLPSCENFSYMALNLVGEMGEFASKVAKAIRKEQAFIGGHDCNDLIVDRKVWSELETDLKSEAGDIFWQFACLCYVMGWKLEDVAKLNLDKLANRQKAGTIITHSDH
jgi:NTP pyrophosphatase (non-canonical NTP hydrolase)